MFTVMATVWRGVGVSAEQFRPDYQAALEQFAGEASGLRRCEAFFMRRDPRKAMGEVGNGPAAQDAWVQMQFDSEEEWRSASEHDALHGLDGQARCLWSVFDAVEYTDALDPESRGQDRRRAEHRNVAGASEAEEGDPGDSATSAGPYTLFMAVYRDPALTHEEYVQHYKDVHWHYVPDTERIKRYHVWITLNDPRPEIGPLEPVGPPKPDSFLVMGYDSEADWLRDAASPQMLVGVEDWDGFLWWVDVEEVEVVQIGGTT